MSDAEIKAPGTENDEIICRVTPWYFRRMGLTAAFLLAFGLYFFYDGKIGYPKENKVGEAKDWFQGDYLKSFETAKDLGHPGTVDQGKRRSRNAHRRKRRAAQVGLLCRPEGLA